MPVYRHDPIHLTDRWDPGRALAIMEEAGIGLGGGATIFLTSLLDHPSFGPRHVELIHSVGLGGSPVPAAVAERAEALGIQVTRAYGSTEHPSITGSAPGEPQAKRNRTDGHALAGVELRIVGEEGRDLPAGQPSEIWSRGPDLFAGYTDPALTARTITGDGWYRTGDVVRPRRPDSTERVSDKPGRFNPRSEDPVVADEMEARRRDQGRELLEPIPSAAL